MQQKSINLSWSKGCFLMRTLHGDAVLFQVCTHVHRIGFQHYFCSAPFTPRDSICPSGEASNILSFTFLVFSLFLPLEESKHLREEKWQLLWGNHWSLPWSTGFSCLTSRSCLSCSVPAPGDCKLMMDLLVIWKQCHCLMQFNPQFLVALRPRDLQYQHSSTKMNWSGLKRSWFLCLGY